MIRALLVGADVDEFERRRLAPAHGLGLRGGVERGEVGHSADVTAATSQPRRSMTAASGAIDRMTEVLPGIFALLVIRMFECFFCFQCNL
jgi:hypothetical protein